jgi:carboxymethylenebutenolidase
VTADEKRPGVGDRGGKHGKMHVFHRYDGAGHGIFYWHRPLYRPEQAMDGWSKVFAFFGKHLAK